MDTHKGGAYQLGQAVTARVERIFPFGIFVRLPDGSPAYVRRRELTLAGNLDPRQVVSEGGEIKALVIGLAEPDQAMEVELSVRRAEPDPWEVFARSYKVGDTVTATVKNLSADGAFVQIVAGVDGYIPLTELSPWPVKQPDDLLWVADGVEAMITALDRPARRVRLSIRRQMIHAAQVEQITEYLQDKDESPEPVPEPDMSVLRDEEEPVDPQALGPVLVLDDHDGVREELVVWLKRHGYLAEGVSRPEDGLKRLSQIPYSLTLVDLDLAGQDGLEFIREAQRVRPDTRAIVMSIPEWIAERGQEIEALRVTEVFTKPLDLGEVKETLARLARGESVGPFRLVPSGQTEETTNSFQRLAKTMRSGAPLATRLEAGLKKLVHLSQAELGVLFRLDPVSQRISAVAQVGHLPLNRTAVCDLAASPVKDLIQEGGEVFETRLSTQARRRFQKVLEVVKFETCLGVPVPAAGRVEHALFLFHREPEAFSRYRLRDAQAMAILLGVALESQDMEEHLQMAGPLLLSGQLAAGFGHDALNKMSALELQVRNLRAKYDGLTGAASPTEPARLARPIQDASDIERLLEATLDLKQTIGAFRDLIGAKDQGAMGVNQVVRRAVMLLQSTARRYRVQIDVDLAPDLPPITGSTIRLHQIFLNVMLNAVQQIAQKLECWPHGAGKLRVTTGINPGAERPVWVRFADNGPGIHHALWENIFALGFSTRPGGTGLGLYIVRSLVESMGGDIAVERSVVPAGTTLLIEFPVTPEASDE